VDFNFQEQIIQFKFYHFLNLEVSAKNQASLVMMNVGIAGSQKSCKTKEQL